MADSSTDFETVCPEYVSGTGYCFAMATVADAVAGWLLDVEHDRAVRSSTMTSSSRTVAKHLVILHGIFRRAMKVWGLPTNPVPMSPTLFANDLGNFQDASSIRIRYRAALTRAGLRQLRFHDLRHS